MINLSNVSFRYPGAEVDSLKNINLNIDEGTFIAIMGSNGSGKTTLCKLFNGLIPHFFTGDIEGEIKIDNLTTMNETVSSLSKIVGYVYQDYENSIVRPTVLDEVMFSAINYGLKDFRHRAEKALQLLSITHLANNFIWELSGGQKHLVALASAIAVSPKYIIIDEPVAQLDPMHARELYQVLKRLNEEHGITIIVIEHHTEFIADFCKEVVLMRQGEIIWKKSVQDGLTELEELEKSFIYPPQVTQIAHACTVHNKLLPITLNQAKKYFNDEKESFSNNYVTEYPSINTSPITVELNDIIAQYRDVTKREKVILNNISVNFRKNDKIALVGNNGAGKSTLLKLLSGLKRPKAGSICIGETDVLATSPEELSNIVSYIHQQPEEMFIEDSIEGDISFFLKARNKENYEETVQNIIETLSLQHLKDRDGRLLSGGQQRRSSLAIGLAMMPKLMLLDEPTASLDILSRRELLKMLSILEDKIETTVIATHDMQLVCDWATRVIVLSKGKIIFDGPPSILFNQRHILEQANLLPPQVVELSHQLNLNNTHISIESMISTFHSNKLQEVKV